MMINELFPFQQRAVGDLRARLSIALSSYKTHRVPQVVSLQAPTGSGKTIIMASLIEDIFFGSDLYEEQPEAIFVWLSDSPQLNEQSKQKFEQKADRIRFDQYVVIADESFDQEMLDDGHIYFLNTQKLGRAGNLSHHSDNRMYTIWETIENTAKEKSDRLYFIIDEAHRGTQGREAGRATTIMQRFILGCNNPKLSPVPVVIGISATAARFNALIGDTSSTLQKVLVSPDQVRASGLLKDRIIITYPEDPTKHNDMAVLQAATDEWVDKCLHWHQYTVEQHYSNVNPVFVVQVAAGTGAKVSNTDLDDVIAKIEERLGEPFKENEVVHTFGSTGTLQISGLSVPHIEPSEIADNRKIRVVLFKENLSTGWDCPRAETMMSFRKAEDVTYIAQLLGRMIRTPLQSRVQVDDTLNEVRLFLPYFNKENVQNVIDELQATEGGEIPTVIDGDSLDDQTYVSWTASNPKKPKPKPIDPNQISIFDWENENQSDAGSTNGVQTGDGQASPDNKPVNSSPNNPPSNPYTPQKEGNESVVSEPAGLGNTFGESTPSQPNPIDQTNTTSTPPSKTGTPEKPIDTQNPIGNKPVEPTAGAQPTIQLSFGNEIDRDAVIKYINEQGFLTYVIRTVKINSYLKSLLSLAGLLTQNLIYQNANDEVKDEVTDLIRNYINDLHKQGKYDDLVKQVMEFKLAIQIFDPFGEAIKDSAMLSMFETSESDLDRQLRAADAKLGGYGFPFVYGRRFIDFNNPNAFKIDCILFAADEDCMKKLNKYAEEKFHALNDKYRKYVVSRSEKCRKEYSSIVANGDIVSKHSWNLPETISVKTDKTGAVYLDHLYANEAGEAKISLNGWEAGVIAEEQKRDDFVCWLRNVSRQSWALCIPYEIDGETKAAYPDFIIIRKDPTLGYIMDILEPHNADFKDNLGKAKGFAKYAAEESSVDRVQLIRMGKDAMGQNRFVRLDMGKGTVRTKVLSAINNDELDHLFDVYGEIQS